MSRGLVDTLAGRWALVTGATRGIGQQIALGLAEFDCNVVVHGRKRESARKTLALLKKYDIETAVVEGDLGTASGVRKVISGVRRKPGHVDILYNNAGLQNEWEHAWDIGRRIWHEAFDVNVVAMTQLMNAFVPGMIERGFGRVVNLSSGIANIPELTPYSASKAAVDKLSSDLATGLEGSNVILSTLDPGWLRTDMGGPHAPLDVTTVLPGALVPVLLKEGAKNGRKFYAQEYEWSD